MNHEEHDIQAAAIKILSADPRSRWMFAIPNGGRRDAITGARLKAEGVRPGVWDLEYPVMITQSEDNFVFGICNGLRIEVKTKKGKLTKEQAEFGIFSDDNGWALSICRSAQEIVDAFLAYREGNHPGNEAALAECRKRVTK